jgi:hypothetical protein
MRDGGGGGELEAGGVVLVELDDGDDATRGAGDRRGAVGDGTGGKRAPQESPPWSAGELRPGRLHGRAASSARAATMVDG